LSIGEVLVSLKTEFPDVTISKIRFLEGEGLINPERTQSGYRKFYEDDVDRLRKILRMQRDEYLPLKVIKERLVREDGDSAQPESEENAAEAAEEEEIAEPPTGLQMSLDEMATATGVGKDLISELESFGLISARSMNGDTYFDGDGVVDRAGQDLQEAQDRPASREPAPVLPGRLIQSTRAETPGPSLDARAHGRLGRCSRFSVSLAHPFGRQPVADTTRDSVPHPHIAPDARPWIGASADRGAGSYRREPLPRPGPVHAPPVRPPSHRQRDEAHDGARRSGARRSRRGRHGEEGGRGGGELRTRFLGARAAARGTPHGPPAPLRAAASLRERRGGRAGRCRVGHFEAIREADEPGRDRPRSARDSLLFAQRAGRPRILHAARPGSDRRGGVRKPVPREDPANEVPGHPCTRRTTEARPESQRPPVAVQGDPGGQDGIHRSGRVLPGICRRAERPSAARRRARRADLGGIVRRRRGVVELRLPRVRPRDGRR